MGANGYRLPIVALPPIYKFNGREGAPGREGGISPGHHQVIRRHPGAWGRAWVGHGAYRHQVGRQGYRIAGYVPGRTGTGASVSANGFRLSLLRAPFRSPPQGKIRFPKQRHCCASSCMCYIAHRFIDEGLMDTIINVLLIFLALTGGVWWFVMLGLMFFYWLNHRRD